MQDVQIWGFQISLLLVAFENIFSLLNPSFKTCCSKDFVLPLYVRVITKRIFHLFRDVTTAHGSIILMDTYYRKKLYIHTCIF